MRLYFREGLPAFELGKHHTTEGSGVEPVAAPGQIYTSEVFAALPRTQTHDRFVCDYLGNSGLAKGYGRFPLYRLRRSGEIE